MKKGHFFTNPPPLCEQSIQLLQLEKIEVKKQQTLERGGSLMTKKLQILGFGLLLLAPAVHSVQPGETVTPSFLTSVQEQTLRASTALVKSYIGQYAKAALQRIFSSDEQPEKKADAVALLLQTVQDLNHDLDASLEKASQMSSTLQTALEKNTASSDVPVETSTKTVSTETTEEIA